MFHHFKVAFRNIRRGGIYSIINVGGLAIGMAAAMLIMLWVYHQWSYDRFHAKKDQLYQVWSRNSDIGVWFNSPKILGTTLVDEYVDVADMTRFYTRSRLLTYEEQKINMATAFADPGFLTMFSFPLLQGDVHTALNDPYSIVLTQEAAKKLFGNDSPMGKTVVLNNKFPLIVTGVMANLPNNTKFDFETLSPYVLLKEAGGYDEDWGNYAGITYVELKPGATEASVNAVIKDVIRNHTNPDQKTEPFLHPITKWNLYSKVENGQITGGLIDTLRLFTGVALLILLIACINFMNLSTARSTKRAKEVGVRKVIGARRGILMRQFLGESILVSAIAAILAIGIVELCLPSFNQLMGKQLALGFDNMVFWAVLFFFILFTGVLAGSYPAFYLSSFLPIKVLKNMIINKTGTVTSRKVLIVTQFSFAIILIISTTVIHRQVQYAQDRQVGYDKDQLISVEMTGKINANSRLIREELLRTGTAVAVTRTLSPMTERWNNGMSMTWRGKDPNEKQIMNRFYVDAGWAATTGVDVIQGRDIDIYTYVTDSTAMLLNETAAQHMGFEEPIGEVIHDSGKEWHVVGVVKDFVMESPYNPVVPMIVGGPAGELYVMHIKLNGANNTANNLAKAEQIFKTYNSEFPFVYRFIDENYARKFADEQRTGTLATWFAILAIFISCLGLFGLSAYMAENRRKEIGVRKVLGASITNITSLLSKEFLMLVSISLVIATPIAWWAMSKWLAGYAYHTNMPWWLFVAVAALTIGIVLFTVSFQAIKAATANPVKAIKSE